MKIIVSSIACSPYAGSEVAYGWRACMAIAKHHDLWVIVSAEYKADLERARREALVPKNVEFIFLGECKPYSENRLLAKIQSWWRYLEFNQSILSLASEWHSKIHFDVAHVLTYTTWRVASPLWRLGIPLVWGPLSGTETFPTQFFSILSWPSRAYEFFRIFQGTVGSYSPSIRECSHRAARIPTTHRQAYDFIVKLRGRSEGVTVFCNVFFAEKYISEMQRDWPEVPPAGALQIFGSGNLEGRKGVALALMALARVKARGIPFFYRVSSSGSELAHLEKLKVELGLENEVSLGQQLSREDFVSHLKSAHIYLLPSLREGAGQTMMEAMLAGCVPIVAKWGGPAEIVTDECGYRLPVKSVEQLVNDIAITVIHLHDNRDLLLTKGRLAQERIAKNYNETVFCKTVDAEYAASLG